MHSSEQGGHSECLRSLHVTLSARVLLQDFHSDNNHPSLDAMLTDHMVVCVLYQLITCNIWQGIKSIDGGL